MNWKKIGKALLFPHIAIMLILLPASMILLLDFAAKAGMETPIGVLSCMIATYTLTVWCIRLPSIIRFFSTFWHKSKYAQQWQRRLQLRVNTSLYATLLGNIAFAVFQLILGFANKSLWFFSLAGYYVSLAVMRLFLVRHTRNYDPGEKMLEEYRKYRICGIIFLIMNLSLSMIIFFMVYWNRTFYHHEITTIIMATFTFSTLTLAIVNIVKFRKYNSPVYSASKAISLASALVSMLTLESTMLTTFGDGTIDLSGRRIFLGVSGGVISAFIIGMAVFMIVQATKKINFIKTEEQFYGE